MTLMILLLVHPFEDVGAKIYAGAIHVAYGSRDGDFTTLAKQTFTRDTPGLNIGSVAGDRFGFSVAGGRR